MEVGNKPWLNEPDEETFFYRGIECTMRRALNGIWHGYIGIPLDHPYAQYEDYDDIPIKVHGGITWGENGCPARKDDTSSKFWIGFDCAHFNDFAPLILEYPMDEELKTRWASLLQKFQREYPERAYRDIEFVRGELKSMVDQVLKGVP